MKKIFLLFLAVSLTLSLSACASKATNTPTKITREEREIVKTTTVRGITKYTFNEPIVLVDSEYVTIKAKGKFSTEEGIDTYPFGTTGPAVGYELEVKSNVDADMDLRLGLSRIGGWTMDPDTEGLWLLCPEPGEHDLWDARYFAPRETRTAYFCFSVGTMEVNTIDDLSEVGIGFEVGVSGEDVLHSFPFFVFMV